ncbi:PREDICTED: (S)-N-methylcoclaurine 3'-hydroxylase isozyme 1-like [Nicotiana attenuata]|uniref:Cytochrome p450 76c2 n=1 Tax=Nicotiana attenuata TaxID=49451 RepID=A0A314L858_NICAT|nr:PREDICTED: (S)-N-methylcoclaurine 3'-hydroxylase isozyme 1-like [Nicotiana attenuata]OIT37830.1 cytochrome p450 76c2 [Nicotiana attenuata]
MDFSSFNLSSLLIFLIPPLIYLILNQINSTFFKIQNLPPAPFQWPLIGNMPNFIGKNPHIIVTKISQKLGPLISLKLGNQIVIIGSSPQSAVEILKTHDKQLSARYAPKATPIKESDLKKYSLLWSTECNSHWKSIRVLWRTELFSNKSMELFADKREKGVLDMVDFLVFKQGKVVKIGDVVFSVVFNILGNSCFSKDMIKLEDERVGCQMKENIWRFMEYSTTPILADFFPSFNGVDILGQKKKAKKCLDNLFKVWEGIVKERREEESLSGFDVKKQEDFLDLMLSNGFSDDQINYMLLEIFPAGTGTLTSTIEWAMAELLRNKEVMKKLYSELQNEINSNPIKESTIFQLPYLNACIKEVLRLHPPIAFLPHYASETCQVMNYTIPKNSLVFVNLWAIGHDPKHWEDPFSFKPERFLNSNLDFKGQDFEFLPFGAGRRMCPGLPFATKQVHLILASLVYHFEWSLPNDGDPLLLDMNEKYAVPLQREKPLLLVPTRK